MGNAFTLDYIRNEQVGGKSLYSQTFVALPQASSYSAFKRLDAVSGARIVKLGRRVDPVSPVEADRRSNGVVEVQLPEGAVLKTITTEARLPASKGRVHSTRVVRQSALIDIPCEGMGRVNDGHGTLKTVVVLDGARVFL